MLIIDTHAHIYSPDEKRYPPIAKPLRPPAGAGSLEELKKTSQAAGVRAVCLIQTSTFYRFDNRYICDSAKANPDWTAGVCTLDPDNPESPTILKRFSQEYGIRGMRSIPGKDGRLDSPGVMALWKMALETGIVINVLINRDNAPDLERMLTRMPKLQVVLDHCLNLKVGPDYETILAGVLRLARFKNLHAKMTFLPTGSKTGFPCADLHDGALKIIGAFGADRSIWGSDFPNQLWTPKVTYAEHLRIFTDVLPLTSAARAAVLGETAKRLWFPKL